MAEQVSIKDFLRKRQPATQELSFDGFGAPFVIREMTNKENESLQSQFTHTERNRAGQKVSQVDTDKYTNALLVKSVVQPDLTSKELQEAYGTLGDAAETLKVMLSMGEFNTLTQAVLDLSGLNDTLEKETDEVKN
jgi:hypothetical protein